MSGMSLERVQWHLNNWADWMDGQRVGSGNRNSASGGMGISHGSKDFDMMVAIADARCADAVDTCIEDLPVMQRIAVHHTMLASVFPFKVDAAYFFTEAKLTLARAIPAKGID